MRKRKQQAVPVFPILIVTILSIFSLISLIAILQQTVRDDTRGTNLEVSAANQLQAKKAVKVLSIAYVPVKKNTTTIDDTVVGPDLAGWSVSQVITKISEAQTRGRQALIDGSRYRNYRVATTPFLDYELVRSMIVRQEKMPRSDQEIPWKIGQGVYRPDYIKILQREHICDWVDNKGVRQVWLWGYHHGNIEPAESNMAIGTKSQAFFNHTSYGDISNSEQTLDLPVCGHTYTVFNYNMTRGPAEFVEDHTHQIERLLNWAGERDAGKYPGLGNLFWEKFVGKKTSDTSATGCGWTHIPPNATTDYDWMNLTEVSTDCADWKPDGNGSKSIVSCKTWSTLTNGTCSDDGGLGFKTWWMQSLPGYGNDLVSRGRYLENWWESVADFDEFAARGGSLHGEAAADLAVTSFSLTPTKLKFGQPATATVTIQNVGLSDATGYTVDVKQAFANNPVLRSQHETAVLKPGQVRTITIQLIRFPDPGRMYEAFAEITDIAPADRVKENNSSKKVRVQLGACAPNAC